MSVDLINNPPHYQAFGFESMELLECVFELMPEKMMIFYIGNALKYAIRSKFKENELQDLKKCEFYVKKCERFLKDQEGIFDAKELMPYLNLIAQKDFKLFLLINHICVFALNPSVTNHGTLGKYLENYIKNTT